MPYKLNCIMVIPFEKIHIELVKISDYSRRIVIVRCQTEKIYMERHFLLQQHSDQLNLRRKKEEECEKQQQQQ